MFILFLLTVLVIVPAIAALLSKTSLSSAAIRSAFAIGVPIVYRHQEMSTRPCSGARDIHPSERGEFYYYSLIDYLRVTEVLRDGRIIAIGRDNKRLCFWPNDSHLRKARVTERFVYRQRFPHF
jgi:hypothetical protein